MSAHFPFLTTQSPSGNGLETVCIVETQQGMDRPSLCKTGLHPAATCRSRKNAERRAAVEVLLRPVWHGMWKEIIIIITTDQSLSFYKINKIICVNLANKRPLKKTRNKNEIYKIKTMCINQVNGCHRLVFPTCLIKKIETEHFVFASFFVLISPDFNKPSQNWTLLIYLCILQIFFIYI